MPAHDSKRPGSPQNPSNVLNDVLELIRTLGGTAANLQNAAANIQAGADRTTSSVREFTLPGGARGVYGISIKTGLGGGEPIVTDFGNLKMTKEGVVVSDTREPLVDVFDEGPEILVVTELPGVTRENITVELLDDVLSLTAQGPRHRYAARTVLPGPVDPASVQESYQNGYLQLRYRKAGAGVAGAGPAPEPDDA